MKMLSALSIFLICIMIIAAGYTTFTGCEGVYHYRDCGFLSASDKRDFIALVVVVVLAGIYLISDVIVDDDDKSEGI